MTARTALDELVEELRGLNGSMLQSTLQALSQAEQARILELLETRPQPSLAFETLASISPWLMQCIEAAGRPATADGRDAMTAATRKTLLEAVRALDSGSTEVSRGKAKRPASLVDRFLRRARGQAA